MPGGLDATLLEVRKGIAVLLRRADRLLRCGPHVFLQKTVRWGAFYEEYKGIRFSMNQSTRMVGACAEQRRTSSEQRRTSSFWHSQLRIEQETCVL